MGNDLISQSFKKYDPKLSIMEENDLVKQTQLIWDKDLVGWS